VQSYVSKFFSLVVLAGGSLLAAGQTPPLDQDRGFTEIESFQGSVNSSVTVLKFDSTMGYDFNKHFGAFTGVPLYLVRVPSDPTTGASGSTKVTGVGNIYLGFVYRLPHPNWNLTSTITGGAPTGSTKKGFSTGRASVDWSNYFDHSFGRFTPFFGAGLANTVPDSPFVKRPFTSLGALGHFEEGADYELSRHFSLGASAYQILPHGTQKVFSQIVMPDNSAGTGQSQSGSGQGQGQGRGRGRGRGQGLTGGAGSGTAGQGNPSRPFETAFLTTGTGLTREYGLGTWIAFEPSRYWVVQAGYSRSVTFHTNSFTFNIALNVGKLIHAGRGH